VTTIKHVPVSEGSFAPYPQWVNPLLKKVLTERGITELYSHQARAIELVRQGRDVVLVTPTASGKTLCYNIPVLQRIIEEPTRAIYLFPTKALANDQMTEVHASLENSRQTSRHSPMTVIHRTTPDRQFASRAT
jgi:DEAD/DEAH box helicase domain-containing protein